MRWILLLLILLTACSNTEIIHVDSNTPGITEIKEPEINRTDVPETVNEMPEPEPPEDPCLKICDNCWDCEDTCECSEFWDCIYTAENAFECEKHFTESCKACESGCYLKCEECWKCQFGEEAITYIKYMIRN